MGKLVKAPAPRFEDLASRGNDLGGCARIAAPKKNAVTCVPGHSSKRKSLAEEELAIATQSATLPTESCLVKLAGTPCAGQDPSQSIEKQIKIAKMANARRPNTTGTMETRPRGMIAEVSRTARAATTTPTASHLRARSREGSLRRAEVLEESPSKEILDEERIARRRARLLELLDSAECLVSRSREPIFDESRMSYHKFIRGYIDASPKHTRHRAKIEEAVTNVIGEGCNSPGRDDRSPCREDMEDHYKYFSRQEPLGESRCQEDNGRRLQRVRIQALAARIALTVDGREVMDKLAWAPMKVDPSSFPKAKKHGKKQPYEPTGFLIHGEDGSSAAHKKQPVAEMLENYDREFSHTGSVAKGGENHQSQGQEVEMRGRRTVINMKKQGLRQTLFLEDGETFAHRGRSQRKKLQKLKTASQFTLNTAAATTQLKAEMRTREACESLRFLVFGYVDDKRSSGTFYEQACGSKDEVMKLHTMWNRMDEDGSGDIEFTEFLSYFSKSKADRLLGMKCVKYLVGTGDENATGCRIEDMMRLVWLKATKADIDLMMHWFKEAEFQRFRAPTPPLLPKRKRREILENFPSLELGAKISYEDLVDTGLVDEPTARQLQHLYDKDNTNVITAAVLLDMMCPNGYRSRKDASTAVDHDGRILELISNEFFKGWIYPAKCGGDGDDN